MKNVPSDSAFFALLRTLRGALGDKGDELGRRYLEAVSALVRVRIERTVSALNGGDAVSENDAIRAIDAAADEIARTWPAASPYALRVGEGSHAAIRAIIREFLALAL